MASREIRRIEKIESHRNGVSGNSFYVVLFVANTGSRKGTNMVATVFRERGSVAVLDRDMTAQGNVTFGENSWRGDHYEPELRQAIQTWEDSGRGVLKRVV